MRAKLFAWRAKQVTVRRHILMVVALLAAIGASGAVAAAASADSGSSNRLWIAVADGAVLWEHWPGSPTGFYHIQLWGVNTTWSTNTPDYWKVTNATERDIVSAPVAKGVTVCANLWYHKPAGGYGSYGLPCAVMS